MAIHCLVALLSDRGSDPNLIAKNGHGPLSITVKCNDLPLVKLKWLRVTLLIFLGFGLAPLVNIKAQSPSVAIGVDNVAASEAAQAIAVITVIRTAPMTSPLTVNYTVAGRRLVAATTIPFQD
jgi:hypothetical protein